VQKAKIKFTPTISEKTFVVPGEKYMGFFVVPPPKNVI
jgi:hypothetical protein